VKEIREWLENGQQYAQGIALYETYGKSRVVLKTLRYGDTEFTRSKLKSELLKLAGGESARDVPIPAKRVGKQPESVGKKAENVPVEPKKVASPAEHPQRRTWYATRAYAHAQLEPVDTDAQRCELAKLILETTAQISASYRAVAAPADVVPGPDLVALDDAGEVRRLLANLRPQRSKLKKRPDRAGELARVVAQITLLELKLKNRDGDQS
jgi:hypothetical protein